MDLKLINDKGQPAATVAGSDALFARDYNEALIHQVVTAYQANARSGNRAAEGPRRRQQVAQEAVGAEGHRPRARGPGQQPAVARRRQDLPELARRELLAEGQPQDVPRGHRVDPVAARARGPAGGDRRARGRRAEDEALRAEDQGAGPHRHRAGRHRQARRQRVPVVAQPARRAGARDARGRSGQPRPLQQRAADQGRASRNSRRCWDEHASTQVQPRAPGAGAARAGRVREGHVHRRQARAGDLQGRCRTRPSPR